MLNLFRTNQIAFNFLLILYALVLRSSVFVVATPQFPIVGEGVLSDWIYSWLGTSGTAHQIVGILLVFLQGVLINILVARFRMAREISLLPGLFYILIATAIPEFLVVSPALLANTFLILSLHELFVTYRKNNAAGNIFNTGFWLSIASLCYFPTTFLIILALIGLSILRAFRPDEFLILLVGFIVPYILCSVYFFWYDQLGEFYTQYLYEQFGALKLIGSVGWDNYLKFSFFGLLLLLALVSYNGLYIAKKNIQAQKTINILFWFLLLTLPTLLFQTQIHNYHLILVTIPLGIFLSFNFQNLSRSAAEAIHLLLLAGILILQFKPLWG